MKTMTLLGILSASHPTDKELALVLVKSAQGSSSKSLEDAFTIALGVGKLCSQDAQNLISALEQLGSTDSLDKHNLQDDPELTSLREEALELIGRQQRLSDEQQLISELQQKVRKMQDKCVEAKAHKSKLENEIKEMQEQLDRINQLEQEIQ